MKCSNCDRDLPMKPTNEQVGDALISKLQELGTVEKAKLVSALGELNAGGDQVDQKIRDLIDAQKIRVTLDWKLRLAP